MGEILRRYFNRQIVPDLVVLWFAVWIVWWFRRWMGHSPAYFPDPTSPGARLYYNVQIHTLARSLMQSFVIACAALLAWRAFLHRTPKGHHQT